MTGEAIEISAAELGSLEVRLDFATVFGLGFEEVPQPTPSSVAILNVTGWCSFVEQSRAGLCVMVVGLGTPRDIIWACCLMAQHREENPHRLLESLLINPEMLGKTERVAVRVYGGQFENQPRV